MPHVAIQAHGHDSPSFVLDNVELARHLALDVDPAWIVSRTGIESRHWMPPGETTSDMATRAARRILERARVEPRDVSRIILSTITPDLPSPATATIVARKLGARCAAFDVSAACAGFLYGLDLGAAAVRAGERNVLVLSADARSRSIDPRDRRTAVLFADGAAGVLLGPSERAGLLGIALGAESRDGMGACVPAGGTAEPASHASVDARRHYVQVDSKEAIGERFVAYTREICELALARSSLGWSDVDLFITHQGNARIVERTIAELGLAPHKALNTIARHGNTVSATVPTALCEALDAGRIGPGAHVLLTAVGAGYTFGAALVRF